METKQWGKGRQSIALLTLRSYSITQLLAGELNIDVITKGVSHDTQTCTILY